MGQKKLKRFAEIRTFSNVMEYPKDVAGKWNEHFKNNHPIILELACGKGEYSVGMGKMHNDRNFIGIDIKGNRIWVGAKQATEEKLSNVAFIRSQIGMIQDYFSANEVSEIWLPFPDPQLRASKCKRRLTHPEFLRKYQQILSPRGYIHLKTDSPVLYRFTKTVIEVYGLELFHDSDDIRNDVKQIPELLIKTHYEGLDIANSNRIHYLKFALKGNLDSSLDAVLLERIKEEEIGKEVESNEEETD
jgi:tRNA (guanine-N7-)-methyltransferase